MLFVTTYHLKEHSSKDESQRLMDLFGTSGAAPGEVAHYVRIDGRGGYTVTENANAQEIYEYVLPFLEFMSFEVAPVLKIDEAVGPILAYLG